MGLFDGNTGYLLEDDPRARNRQSIGAPTGAPFFAGPATGTSVAPVAVDRPQGPTPTPSIPIGGFTPDYAALIRSDPGYMAYLNSGRLDISQAASQRRAALQRLAVQYGGLPSGLKDNYGDIDQGTLELAGKNQFSDKALLERQSAAGIEAFKKALAARQGLQSGELGYGLDQAEYARGQREYDLSNQFAGAAQGAVNDYLGTESRIRQGESDAIARAQAAVFANPANRPVDAEDAPLVEGSLEQYGQPIYRRSDGSLWTLEGKPFQPTNTSTAPAPYAPAPETPAPPQENMMWIQDPNTGQIVQVPADYNVRGYGYI